MMLSMLLTASMMIGQAPAAAPSALAPRPARGPARVTALAPSGQPGSFTIYADLEEAGRAMRLRALALKAGRDELPEGTLSIAHNTPVTVGRVQDVPVDGRPVSMAEITIGAGPLKGRAFWISARRLRGFNEPDPASAALAAAPPAPAAADPPSAGSSLAAKRRAKKQAAYAARLSREAREAIAAAAAAKDYEKMYKEMLPYMLENQRQMLERMSAAERNAALQRMAGAMERASGYATGAPPAPPRVTNDPYGVYGP
jgi:hypothetical protein